MADVKPIVVYGNGKLAELVLHAFADDPRYPFCAVAADARFTGLPVVPFETLEQSHPPADADLLVAVGYARMRERRAMFERAKAKGYPLASCVGRGARVYPDLAMGENVIVFDLAYVGPGVRLGSNTIVRPQSYVGHDGVIGDHVIVSPAVTIGGHCRIGPLSFLGIGSTVLDRLTVAEECLIGAGALVAGDTLSFGCYVGQPAKRVADVRETGVVVGP
jgi:sugar O-acyltransferase (sialic acid O-acetyltransferase NeuD family)